MGFPFGKSRKDIEDERQSEENQIVESSSVAQRIEQLESERDDLEIEINGLRETLNELRVNYREADETYRDKTNALRDAFIKTEDAYREKIQNLAVQCATETADYEHEFHSSKSDKEAQLAILDSKIKYLLDTESDLNKANQLLDISCKKLLDAKEKELNAILENRNRDFDTVVAAKNAEIDRLNKLINEFMRMLRIQVAPGVDCGENELVLNTIAEKQYPRIQRSGR